MNAHDLRQLSVQDLSAKVRALEEDLFKVRFQRATAQLSDTSQVRKTRRTLARAITILGQLKAAKAADAGTEK